MSSSKPSKPPAALYFVVEVIFVTIMGMLAGGLIGLVLLTALSGLLLLYTALMGFGAAARFVLVGGAIGGLVGMVGAIRMNTAQRRNLRRDYAENR